MPIKKNTNIYMSDAWVLVLGAAARTVGCMAGWLGGWVTWWPGGWAGMYSCSRFDEIGVYVFQWGVAADGAGGRGRAVGGIFVG